MEASAAPMWVRAELSGPRAVPATISYHEKEIGTVSPGRADAAGGFVPWPAHSGGKSLEGME